jgi:CRP/FNR family transcriptional regulator, cyclic AMP receptor protein
MATGANPGNENHVIRDGPLVYLPRKSMVEYRRGQIIFNQAQPSDGLHLLVQGRVKVASAVDNGSLTIIDIYTANEYFGEDGLLGLPSRSQTASALDSTTLMSWTTAEVEDAMDRQPKLGMALVQMMVQRCLDFEERLQSFALEKTTARVARSLLRFAGRLGVLQEDGSMRIPPLTHQVLSEYVGTSREIVTFQMNYLRQQGYLDYSRKGINVRPEALREYLRREAQNLPS